MILRPARPKSYLSLRTPMETGCEKLFDILVIFKLHHSIYQVYQEYIATGFYEHQAIVETNSYMSHEKTL